MISCASEELKSNTVSLTMKRQKNFIAHELVFFELKVEYSNLRKQSGFILTGLFKLFNPSACLVEIVFELGSC
jgi:hypothetical protein